MCILMKKGEMKERALSAATQEIRSDFKTHQSNQLVSTYEIEKTQR